MRRVPSRRASLIVGGAIVLATFARPLVAAAQQHSFAEGAASPNAPVTPYGFPVPTQPPVVNPDTPSGWPNGEPTPENAPPFDRPLPPAIQLPPAIRIPRAMPPPLPDIPKNPLDVGRTPPAQPGRPAPQHLPERPDEVTPPAGEYRQSLSELDRRMGLGGSGPVVSMAREVAQSEWVTGHAVLEVMTDRSGRILSARVVEASRDNEGWLRYAEKLREASRSTMRLPEQARGVWTLLDVRVGNELSSGHRRWWSLGVAVTFDIADVNARRLRTVHTTVLSEVWF